MGAFLELADATEGRHGPPQTHASDDARMARARLGQTPEGHRCFARCLAQRGTPQIPEDPHDHDCLTFNFKRMAPTWLFRKGGHERSLAVSGSVEPFNPGDIEEINAVLVGAVRTPAGVRCFLDDLVESLRRATIASTSAEHRDRGRNGRRTGPAGSGGHRQVLAETDEHRNPAIRVEWQFAKSRAQFDAGKLALTLWRLVVLRAPVAPEPDQQVQVYDGGLLGIAGTISGRFMLQRPPEFWQLLGCFDRHLEQAQFDRTIPAGFVLRTHLHDTQQLDWLSFRLRMCGLRA
jgi:hypothetical protein